jgi:hypothetical protein
MLQKFNFKEFEKSNYQADIAFQASIIQHPHRKRSPKRQTTGRILQTKRGSRIRGIGSKSAAVRTKSSF